MERPVECNDGIEYSDYAKYNSQDCSSDLTVSENDCKGECGFTSTASVEPTERHGLKREYSVFVDSGAVVPEGMLQSRIMHEQFAMLRAAVPNLCTDEKASILTGACEYIEKLQRQEAELRCELGIESCDEEELSCCDDEVSSLRREDEERAVDSSAAVCSEFSWSHCGCSQATVEVVRMEEGLRIHIECEMRPGLLLEIMDLLESSGLILEEASIECVERLVFHGIGLEDVEGNEGGKSRQLACVSAEVVGASLRSLIGDQRQGNTEQEA